MVVDDQVRVRWMNQTACNVMGYRLEDIVGTSVFDIVHPDDLGYMLSSWRSASITRSRADRPGESAQQRRLMAGLRDHRAQPAEDDTVGGMVITARDLSRQSALADSPARLRSMVDRTTDIVLLLGAHSRFSFANRRLTVLSGHDSDRIIAAVDRDRPPRRRRRRHRWFDQLIAREVTRHRPRRCAWSAPATRPCTSSCTARTRSRTR